MTRFIAPDGADTVIEKVIGTDGHCISHITETLSNQVMRSVVGGIVEITNGYYLETTTYGPQTFAPFPRTSRFLFVRMSGQELVFKCEGQDDEMIWRRQK